MLWCDVVRHASREQVSKGWWRNGVEVGNPCVKVCGCDIVQCVVVCGRTGNFGRKKSPDFSGLSVAGLSIGALR